MKDVRHGLDLDTSPEAARIQREMLRRLTPQQRLEKVMELNRAVEELAIAGIRHRYPDASDREVFLRLAVRKLGEDLARKAYPDVEAILGASR
jgi:HEPN domain-containing protein